MTLALENLQGEFWARVDRSAGPDGDWIWTGHIAPSGYGVFCLANKNYLAHRLAYEFHHGEKLGVRRIRRQCKSRACCNPAHFRRAVTPKRAELLRRAS